VARLDPSELRARLAFDYEVVSELRSPRLEVTAHASTADAMAGRALGVGDGKAGRAVAYAALFRFPVLVGPARTTPETRAVFDLRSGSEYPDTEPLVTIVSRPLPWSPHVHPSTGGVCIGEMWKLARGRMLFAQLLIHVMHCLNCDEPDRGPHYTGWNADAIRYWRTEMRCRPLHPDLVYPVLPMQLTHGTADEDGGFEALGATMGAVDADAFVPMGGPR